MSAAERTRIRTLAVWAALALLPISSVVAAARGAAPMDFYVYWTAAHAFINGGDPFAAAELPFVYPPSALWLFAPLGALDVGLAGAIWSVICWASVVAAAIGFNRLVGLKMRPELAVGLTLLYFPAYRALGPLNVALILLAALVACALERGDRAHLVEFLLGLLAGVVLSLKPYWLTVAAPLLVIRGRWSAVGGLLSGCALMLGASMAQKSLWDAFLLRVQWVLQTQQTVDIWKLSPTLGGVVALIWLGGLFAAWRSKHEDAWLFPFTAVLVWTRAYAYGYLVMLPVVWWLVARLGKRGAIVAVLLSTPLGMLTIVSFSGGTPVIDLGWGPLAAAMNWGYWFVTLGVTIYLSGVLTGRFRQHST